MTGRIIPSLRSERNWRNMAWKFVGTEKCENSEGYIVTGGGGL
jgi:hypothetical protein